MNNHSIFKQICKECGGKCCKTTIFITIREYNTLLKEMPIQQGQNGCIELNELGQCSLLSNFCCSLEYNKKPLDCRIFPMTFLLNDKEIHFYLNHKCKYVQLIPLEWINITKDLIIKETQNWTMNDFEKFSRVVILSIKDLEEI